MNNKIPPFLKKDGDSLLFNTDGEFVFYVDEMQFDRNFAEIIGDKIKLLGIITYQIIDKNGKKGKIKLFDFPTIFLTSPSHIEKKKNLQLGKQAPSDYRILHYKKGDKIVVSTRVPMIIQNSEIFYRIFLTGKLPTSIPYDQLADYFIENIHLNGGDYGIIMQLFGIIVSKVCRKSDDLQTEFRLTDMKDMNDYQFISIKQVPEYVSAFSAVTSENIDESIVHGIINKKKVYSPLERLMMS